MLIYKLIFEYTYVLLALPLTEVKVQSDLDSEVSLLMRFLWLRKQQQAYWAI